MAAGLPSNILIIYLQTYKNKVSKVVILVVIFQDCFDDFVFFPLIVSKALIDLGESCDCKAWGSYFHLLVSKNTMKKKMTDVNG